MRVRLELEGGPLEIDDELLAPYANPPAATPVRMAYAAAHVVLQPAYADVPHSLENPGSSEEIAKSVDWVATMRLRERLDVLGFGVAEAMDTAQRFQLGWNSARRLIEECGALRLEHGFVAGAGTDHVDTIGSREELCAAVVHQIGVIEEAGGIPIILPSPWLTANGTDPDGYVEVYSRIIDAARGPLLVHWLGEMFLPSLRGYFPGDSFARVMAHDAEKVTGAKLSLLDADLERRVRAELGSRGQVVLTGDDFHFSDLILGEDGAFSHALLGVFDGVARPAGLALAWLASGDTERFRALMEPCEAYGQWVFQEPTAHYKSGLAFTSWLEGLQDNFMLVNHEEHARDRAYYIETARRAAAAGVFTDAEASATRLEAFLTGGS